MSLNTYDLPRADLNVTRLMLGCMNLGGDWRQTPPDDDALQRARTALETALEQGINCFDHADIYAATKSEKVFSMMWEDNLARREDVIVQSKCGIRFPHDPDERAPHRYDFSYEHIMRSVDGSLERLKTEYLDILLLHRPDVLVEPEEVAKAFSELHKAGKVRHFGVSNHTPAQIELLSKYVEQPIAFNQIQFNLLFSHILDAGIVHGKGYESPSYRGEDIVEYSRLNGITIQAWSPLVQGTLTGRMPADAPEHVQETEQLVREMADEKGVSREAILIAWILRHPAKIMPIIGTLNPDRIKGCCEGDGISLSREEWYKLFLAGRGQRLP